MTLELNFAQRYLLVVGGLFYLPFGLLLIVEPAAMFAKIGVLFGSAMALEEVRASHGGVWVLTGLFCIGSIWQRHWVKYLLFYLMVLNGGFAMGRIVSLLVGGIAATQILPLLGFDLLLLLSSVLLLRSEIVNPAGLEANPL